MPVMDVAKPIRPAACDDDQGGGNAATPYRSMAPVQPGTLGWAIREARLDQEMTQAQLACAVGVHQAQISAFERGEVRRPDPQTLAELERVLGLEDGRLLAIAHGKPRYPNVRTEAMHAAAERFGLLEELFVRVQALLDEPGCVETLEQSLGDISTSLWAPIVEQVEVIQNHGAG